jgi:hypothetical protein
LRSGQSQISTPRELWLVLLGPERSRRVRTQRRGAARSSKRTIIRRTCSTLQGEVNHCGQLVMDHLCNHRDRRRRLGTGALATAATIRGGVPTCWRPDGGRPLADRSGRMVLAPLRTSSRP